MKSWVRNYGLNEDQILLNKAIVSDWGYKNICMHFEVLIVN